MKRTLLIMLQLSSLAIITTSALAVPVAPDNRCTAALTTQDNKNYLLHVPLVVPLLDSTSTSSPMSAYWVDLAIDSSSCTSSCEFQLKDYGVTSEASPYNCHVGSLTLDSNGAVTLDVPTVAIGNDSLSIRLAQKSPGSATFTPTNVAAAEPPSLPPGIALQCIGVTHGSGESYIRVCTTFTNVSRAAGFNNIGDSITTGAAVRFGQYWPGTNMLYGYCVTYKITSYGSYGGLVGVSTDGGFAAVPWDVNVTSASRACEL